jgi:phytanoyl-CoA hydroxylase
VPDFLTVEELRDLTENLQRYIQVVVPTLSDSHAFYQEKGAPDTLKQLQHMGQFDPYFARYRKHQRWVAFAETLLGEQAAAKDPEWFNKPPMTMHVTPPHQDNYYFCLRPPNVLTMWLALDLIDEENGCLRYVPGSHRAGRRPHGRTSIVGFSQGITDYGVADQQSEIAIRLHPGDLVCHHGELIHRADANFSPVRSRRAFAMVAEGASCRRDEVAFRRYQAAVRDQQVAAGLQV